MINYDEIDNIIESLIRSGSDIPYIKELREESISEIKKDKSLDEVLKGIAFDIDTFTEMFLNEKNEFNTSLITGISTGIYLPSKDGSFKYTVIGGNKTRNSDEKVDSDTVFDLASVTKLYTLILAFKLEELGLIDLDARVKDVNPTFSGLNDFTFNDLIKLFGELRTDGNVATSSSIEEAYQRFKTLYLVSDDKTKVRYNDFGSMVIGDTIEKIVSNKLGKKMTLDEIMSKYLFEPLNIHNTMFKPEPSIVSGNGYGGGMPHDPKSRALGGVTGHAGLFSNSMDIMKLANALFNGNILNKAHIKRLSEKTFEGVARGNMGSYLKHPDGYKISFNPPEFSKDSFTFQGWSGSIASFDLNNKIHSNILVNAIEKSDDKSRISNDKPVGFSDYMDKYQMELTKRIMLLYIVKKYYNKYCNIKEDVEVQKVM